jgi:hypothetical protein
MVQKMWKLSNSNKIWKLHDGHHNHMLKSTTSMMVVALEYLYNLRLTPPLSITMMDKNCWLQTSCVIILTFELKKFSFLASLWICLKFTVYKFHCSILLSPHTFCKESLWLIFLIYIEKLRILEIKTRCHLNIY